MTNIGMALPDLKDIISLLRGVGPLVSLRKLDPTVKAFDIHALDWTVFRVLDILFMQRPHDAVFVKAIERAKKHGVPVWVDYDDYMLDVPDDNQYYKVFKENRHNIETILTNADVVTVSTDELKAQYSKFNDNVRVVKNAFDDYLLTMKPNPIPLNKTILWRGGTSHNRDLMEVKDVLIELSYSDVARDWRWVFMGFHPFFVTEKMRPGSYEHIGMQDPIDYYENLRRLAPSIMIVPLADTLFNRCKSSISYYEGSYAGATTLVRDLPEFRETTAITYADNEDFKNKLKHLIELGGDGASDAHFGWVCENRRLSQINHERLRIVRELLT